MACIVGARLCRRLTCAKEVTAAAVVRCSSTYISSPYRSIQPLRDRQPKWVSADEAVSVIESGMQNKSLSVGVGFVCCHLLNDAATTTS